jgi:hypothetical protein
VSAAFTRCFSEPTFGDISVFRGQASPRKRPARREKPGGLLEASGFERARTPRGFLLLLDRFWLLVFCETRSSLAYGSRRHCRPFTARSKFFCSCKMIPHG